MKILPFSNLASLFPPKINASCGRPDDCLQLARDPGAYGITFFTSSGEPNTIRWLNTIFPSAACRSSSHYLRNSASEKPEEEGRYL
jgi:hypothetical protein